MSDDLIAIVIGFIALLLGPIALFFALAARKRLAAAERQIGQLRAEVAVLIAALPASQAGVSETSVEIPPERLSEPISESLADGAAEFVPADPILAPTTPPSPAETTTPIPPARPPKSFEETLGTRWSVWVGGLALALGALLLVRYSIEQSWFGPGVRILVGLVFSAALAGTGELLRRREKRTASPSQIPAVLTAAGTVAAFGAVYAAHALYDFIGPATTFAALGLTGLACMAAAALHGPALAGLGLLGALGTPFLVRSNHPDPWPLVAYLAVVVASAYGLARLRRWRWMALAGAAGAGLWGIVLLDASVSDQNVLQASLTHAVVQTLLAALIFAFNHHVGVADAEAELDPASVAIPSLFGVLALVAFYLAGTTSAFGVATILTAGIGIAILTATGLSVAPAAGLTMSAAIMIAACLFLWPGTTAASFDAIDLGTLWPAPRDRTSFASFAIVSTFMVAIPSGTRLLNSVSLRAKMATFYAGAAALTPLAALALVYLRFRLGSDWPFATLAGGLAAAFLGAAALFRKQFERASTSSARLGLGSYAAATLAALALGLVFALSSGALTVALALAALGAAYVDRRLDIAALRWCVAGIGLLVAGRLAWEPRIVGDALGTTPIFNWLLWGYGIPAAAFGLAAHYLRWRRDDLPVHVAQSLAILFAAFLFFFEIRHALNGGDAFSRHSGLLEQGLMTTTAFGFSIALTKLDMIRTSPVLRVASLAFGILSYAAALFGLLIANNPIFSGEAIAGGAILNIMPLAYGLPAVMALLLARIASRNRPDWYRDGAQVSAALLAFALANLEVRHVFQGPHMSFFHPGTQATSDVEWYAYSALWLSLGVAVLAFGIWRVSFKARLASSVLIVATVLKVFLFDLAGLEGILRALSVIGLGVVLIGIGLVYQKLVFSRPSGPASKAP